MNISDRRAVTRYEYRGFEITFMESFDADGYPTSEWEWVMDGKLHSAPSLQSACNMVDYLMETVAA